MNSSDFYISNNLSYTWNIKKNINAAPILSISIDGNNIVAATKDNQIYISSDLGSNWNSKEINDASTIFYLYILIGIML